MTQFKQATTASGFNFFTNLRRVSYGLTLTTIVTICCFSNKVRFPEAYRKSNFLEMQYFNFAQIRSTLPKSNHFCQNFSSILSKFCLEFAQI